MYKMKKLLISIEGSNLNPLSFKLYPDTKVFRMFHKFSKYNEIDLMNLTFFNKGVPILDYESTVKDNDLKDDDEIRVIYETHVYKKN